jgi:alanine racemase
MVRCGILLYGTGEIAERMGLKPVMRLKTVVSTIKDFDAGTPISYGRAYYTEGPCRIAVLPIGYADGLHRALSNKLVVRTPYGNARQVGRIRMDMCMVDVTDQVDLKPEDEVEIYGEHVLCATAAKLCDTIPYELLCDVSKRVPRLYFEGGKLVDRSDRP